MKSKFEIYEMPDTLEVHGKYTKNFSRAKIRLFGEKIIGILGFLISVRLCNTGEKKSKTEWE